MDAENYDAYLGLAMAEARTATKTDFQAAYTDRRVNENGALRRARQFAGAEQLAWWTKLDSDRKTVDEKKAEKKRLEEERRKAAEKAERERIEAERKAEEERKRKAEAQAKEDADKVIAAIRKKLSEKGPSLETQLTATKQRAVELAQLCAAYNDIQAQTSQKKTLIEQYEQKKNQLQKRRASLGLFAGKEKKQIDSELSDLDRQAAQASSEHSNLHKRLQGFETKAQAEQAKAKAEASVSELEQKIFEQKAAQSKGISYETAVNVLSKNMRVRELVYQKDADLLRSIPVGAFLIASVDNSISSISFGHYPQKDSGAPKPIEWVKLRKDSDRLLLISKYALDCKPFNTTSTSVTWETCSLRKWLNNEFLNAAFTAEEQKLIPTVTVSADKNPEYSASPGNTTQDRVFLLSIPEVNKYFKSDEARKCAPTDYAIAQGAYTSSSDSTGGKAACWWWLRSPGRNSNYAAYVSIDGSVYFGGSVYSDFDAVRPALWINLEP